MRSRVQRTRERKRSQRRRWLELLLWVALAFGTAALLVALSETLLPSNF